MKTVLYYTSSYFFDISLEIINILKEQVDLHVLIEITPSSKTANIINIKNLPEGKYIVTPQEILNEKDYQCFLPFFDKAKSVHFVIHHHPTGFSLSTIKVLGEVKKYINKIKPDALHFEGYTLRTLGLIPQLFKINKLVLTVHDAVLHSGENSWKSILPRTVFFRLPVKKTFLFYSAFSRDQFLMHTKHSKSTIELLGMYPFSYYSQYATAIPTQQNHILFFGRISKYKGVDVLLDAMPKLLSHFPEEKLIIAGKGADDELLNHPVLKNEKYDTVLINRYIPNEELVGLIKQAKLIICPYIDATQSGVLMTAFALNKPVIASNVGAFAEQIKNDINGYLVPAGNSDKLADAIIHCLTDELYLKMENNLQLNSLTNQWEKNRIFLKKAYE